MSIEEIVSNARTYYRTGATRSYSFRMMQLNLLEDAIKKNEKKLMDALRADLNKSAYESYITEIGIVLEEIRYHKRHLKSWMKSRRISNRLSHFPAVGYRVNEPFGVVLIVSPWNYPINLTFEALVGAISAGNCAVIKPSAYSEKTSHVIKEIIEETFAPEYISVVEGGRAENQALFNQKFDYIFFTGSVNVGKTVMEAASKHLTPVTLELGGKSPVIVDKTADIRVAAKRLVFGKALNAGQTCIAPDYLLIHESVRDEFIEEFKKAVDKAFPSGNFEEMPTIINEKHFNRLSNLLTQGKIAVGGNTDSIRRFIEPSVLVDVNPDDEIMTDEIFGPILPVITYKSLHECIEFITNRPRPLAFYVFTRDKRVVHKLFNSCSFGGGCVNDVIMHITSPTLPFGGVGNSGMGSYHGRKSFETFTHARSVLVNNFSLEAPLRYHPYTDKKMKIMKRYFGNES